jgi:hypothetical protein
MSFLDQIKMARNKKTEKAETDTNTTSSASEVDTAKFVAAEGDANQPPPPPAVVAAKPLSFFDAIKARRKD